jgi:hypothetical protein
MRTLLIVGSLLFLTGVKAVPAQVAPVKLWEAQPEAFRVNPNGSTDTTVAKPQLGTFPGENDYRWVGLLAGIGLGAAWTGIEYGMCSNSEERHAGCLGRAARHGAAVGAVFGTVGLLVGWSIRRGVP